MRAHAVKGKVGEDIIKAVPELKVVRRITDHRDNGVWPGRKVVPEPGPKSEGVGHHVHPQV